MRRRDQERTNRHRQLEDLAQAAISEVCRALQPENKENIGIVKSAIERGKQCVTIFSNALGNGFELGRFTYHTSEGNYEDIEQPIDVVRRYLTELYELEQKAMQSEKMKFEKVKQL